MTDTITAGERAALTLPGVIPGLLRMGSPVTHIDGSHLVVVELDGDDAKLPSGWAYTRLLDLDLTDATGRAHAAWWLARQPYSGNVPTSWAVCRVVPMIEEWSGELRRTVLVALDPNDPRLLPDDSRWVDAEALRLVCLHVAGLGVADENGR